MAEIAGPNPAEPIVLFAIGHTAAVYSAFSGALVYYEAKESPVTLSA